MSKQMWGTSWCAQGWGAVLFIWVYEPLCRHLWHVEPWSLQTYGLLLIGTGVVINIIQWVLEP